MASSPRKSQAAPAAVVAPAAKQAPAIVETAPVFNEPAPVVSQPEPVVIQPVVMRRPPSPSRPPLSPRRQPSSRSRRFPSAAVKARFEEVVKMFQVPNASMSEMQDKFRGVIEKGLAETRANYAKAKSAADEASSALEASFTTAKTGVAEINVKAFEAMKATAEANFDFVKSILGVKSVADYVTLHTEFARKQVEMMTGQTKEIGALAKKVADQSVEPIKAQVAKTFKVAV